MSALSCIPLREAAKPLKQCLLTRQNNTLFHVFDSRCCIEEIAVPCQESFAKQELELCLILSTANVVETFKQSSV